MRISIVIPTYNESDSIVGLVKKNLDLFPEAKIHVVDDSRDLSVVKVLDDLKDSRVSVVHRSEKGGRGSAVIHGMSLALDVDADIIVEMDADFSHSPDELPALIKRALEGNFDLLIASRYKRDSKILNWPLKRRLFSRAANAFAKMLLRIPISDYTNGYRCYSKAAVKHVVATCGVHGKGFISLSEILVQLYCNGFCIGEVSSIFVNRVRGESSVNVSELKNAFIGLFKIYGVKKYLERRSRNEKLAKRIDTRSSR